MTRVGLVAKPDAAQAQSVILKLLDWFGGRGVSVILEKETAGLVPAGARLAGYQTRRHQSPLRIPRDRCDPPSAGHTGRGECF